jgi:hypothetical protein
MNRVQQANDALADFLTALFAAADPASEFQRNPDGARKFGVGTFHVVLEDDEEPEVVRVLTGPIYDLKANAMVTLARRLPGDERRAVQRDDVDAIRIGLEADPTLNGAVEDARISMSETAEMDRAKWMGGGLDLTIRLLFAAPSPAG